MQIKCLRLLTSLALTVVAIAISKPAAADPCGMVPPIYPAGQPIPLTRVGLQQTYAFYKDGAETFVIRPGFTGKVDEFGMLIPFPTPPAIRKVPDHIFTHLAVAVDPPEVVVDLRPRPPGGTWRFRGRMTASDKKADGLEWKEKVTVLKKEAVGMYEVAVLQAGSADALKRWMDEHGYKYPDGMDKPCNDYVESGWCFVAVKTKIGQKDGVDPKPGQRNVDSKLPRGSTFDGHVQGMGFRFKSDELVVPMRLSAFNKGELRNVVYLMTDGPRKIRSIPEEYVVRQLTGKQLYKNLTNPLKTERRKTVEQSLSKLKDMTLTVIDGDFPREVVGKQNLTFAEYKMPSRRNRPASYDAKVNGPAPKKPGALNLGALTPPSSDSSSVVANNTRSNAIVLILSGLAVALAGLVFVRKRRFSAAR